MLRDYQVNQNINLVNCLTAGHRYVLSILPTGAGKTVCMSDLFLNHQGYSYAIAHRQELVSQISLALARCGVDHNILAPSSVVAFCSALHVRLLNKNFVNPNSNKTVAGVDTLLRRNIPNAEQVTLVQIDEGHHVLENNKWGQAVQMFPNAVGIGWTATPIRSDKKPLTAGYGGIYTDLVIGPTKRELISRGHLCDYKIHGPPNPMDIADVRVSKATGDFNAVDLRNAAHRSEITGDLISHYRRFAAGKRGVIFAVDVELAHEYADAFNEAGIPAAAVSAKTPDRDRVDLIEKLRSGELMLLANVDIFGEGFDLPAIEVVIMARPTQSYALYVQQFGRALRTMPGKSHGVIIDHVGNTARHGGPPDDRCDWFLETPERKQIVPRTMPVRSCVNPDCFMIFEGWSPRCPYCGHKPEPEAKDRPEHVEGDLIEYDQAIITALKRRSEQLTAPAPFHAKNGLDAIKRDHWNDRAESHKNLKDAISWWGGVQRDVYRLSDSEAYRKFWYTFGIDVLSAQTLSKRADVEKLYTQIWDDIECQIPKER